MSAEHWKLMTPFQRLQAVDEAAAAGSSLYGTAAKYGVEPGVILRLAERNEIAFFSLKNTDEGKPAASTAKPPERPACEGTSTPAAAKNAPGEGGPDGDPSGVAAATSNGGAGGLASSTSPATVLPGRFPWVRP